MTISKIRYEKSRIPKTKKKPNVFNLLNVNIYVNWVFFLLVTFELNFTIEKKQQQQQQQKQQRRRGQPNQNQHSKHKLSSNNNQFIQLDSLSSSLKQPIEMGKNSLGQLNRKQQQQQPYNSSPINVSKLQKRKKLITNDNDEHDDSICIEINDHHSHSQTSPIFDSSLNENNMIDTKTMLLTPKTTKMICKMPKNDKSVFDIFDSPNDKIAPIMVPSKTNQSPMNINHSPIDFDAAQSEININKNHQENQQSNALITAPSTPTLHLSYKFQLNNDSLNVKNDYQHSQQQQQQPWSFTGTNHQRQSSLEDSMTKKSPICTRISILGKPLPSRKEVSYYRQRFFIYNILQRPKGFWASCYHQFVISIIVIGLILFAMSTVEQYYEQSIQFLRIFDTFILALLVLEFLARAWSSSCISQYQGWFGLFRFCTSAFRLIDIFIIMSTAAVLWVHQVDPSIANRINWLRFAQAFQILRISHRFKPWRIMASVIWNQRDHLAVAIYMCTLSLIFITFTVYFIEHNQPDTDFTSIPRTLWWGIVSLLTIGYGDMVPSTTAGKIVASTLLLICFSSFALPAGILGTGLALKVQEQQRQKHFNKRRDPAARLIQCAWRCYASSKNSRSIATWKACMKQRNKLKNISASNSNDKLSEHQIETSSTLGSVVDLKCLRNKIHKRFGSESQASLVDYARSNTIDNSLSNRSSQSLSLMVPRNHCKHRLLERTTIPIILNDDDEYYDYYCEYFNPAEKAMIRFIRLVKFEVAKKNFKNAFRPYDINDVIEQYAAGHADVVARVKNMHSRINNIQNTLGNVTKICQDLSYIQYHQMDRLERIIQELNQKLLLVDNHSDMKTPTTTAASQTNKFLSVNDSLSSDDSSLLSMRSLSPSTSSSSSSPEAIQSSSTTIKSQCQSNDDDQTTREAKKQ